MPSSASALGVGKKNVGPNVVVTVAPVTPSLTALLKAHQPPLPLPGAITKCAHQMPRFEVPALPVVPRAPVMPAIDSARLSGNVGGLRNQPAFAGTVGASDDQLVKVLSGAVPSEA